MTRESRSNKNTVSSQITIKLFENLQKRFLQFSGMEQLFNINFDYNILHLI